MNEIKVKVKVGFRTLGFDVLIWLILLGLDFRFRFLSLDLDF